MRLLLTLMMTAFAGTLAACAAGRRPLRAPGPLDWRAVVGCYRMTQGPVTGSFVLDSASTGEEGVRSAHSLVPPQQQDAREDWRVTDGDTVVYFRHEGWGQVMEFVVRGDSLIGTHYLVYDVVGYEPARTPAAAVREPCRAGGS